jgi:peroxiredoxin
MIDKGTPVNILARFALALSLALAASAPMAALAIPHTGDVAPPFSIAKVGGGTIDLSKFRGKPVYVNFFASWCGPCNEEAPDVAKLYHTYHARGLTVVGVDELEDASKAGDFVHTYAWPFAVGVDGDGSVGHTYGALGLPVHVFIDKRGNVSTYRLGEMDHAEIEEAIKKIL